MHQFRLEVLLAFDGMCIVRGQPATITPELRAAILHLLRLNWSQKRVAATLHVGLLIVRRCAIPAHASTWKRGRGRRFSVEQWQAIIAAVKAGRRSADIERAFRCDWHTVTKIRHSLGDFENRRHWTKLSPEQVEQAAAQVGAGARWRDVAAQLGVSPTTLLRWCRYRKRASFRHFTDEEKRAVFEAVKRGEGKRRIAETLGRPRSSIGLLTQRLRAQHPNLPRRAGILPKQKAAIFKARSNGLSYAKVGRLFNLSAGGVHKIIKRGNACLS